MRPQIDPDYPVVCESCGVPIDYLRGLTISEVQAIAADIDDDEFSPVILCEFCNPPERFDENELYRQFFM